MTFDNLRVVLGKLQKSSSLPKSSELFGSL